MSNNISNSSHAGSANRADFYRGGGPKPAEERESPRFRGMKPGPPPLLDYYRGGAPMPAEYSPGLPANIGETDPAQFLGAAADYQSRETAALAVRTADGDKVRISFDAVSRIAARDDSAEGESSFSVQVRVKGTLDDNEVAQISELLRRLVTTSRSEEPTAIQTGGLESLDRFKFAYKAYERLSLAVPDAQMA